MTQPTTHDLFQDFKSGYHAHLGHLSARGMERKVRGGGYPGCAPTGYRNVRSGKDTRIEVDPMLGPLVVQAFYLAGRDGSSLRKVLAELTPRGLCSHQGNALSPAALRGMLTNPFYVGVIRYQGQEYPGNHPSLITASLFERVQRRLRERRR